MSVTPKNRTRLASQLDDDKEEPERSLGAPNRPRRDMRQETVSFLLQDRAALTALLHDSMKLNADLMLSLREQNKVLNDARIRGDDYRAAYRAAFAETRAAKGSTCACSACAEKPLSLSPVLRLDGCGHYACMNHVTRYLEDLRRAMRVSANGGRIGALCVACPSCDETQRVEVDIQALEYTSAYDDLPQVTVEQDDFINLLQRVVGSNAVVEPKLKAYCRGLLDSNTTVDCDDSDDADDDDHDKGSEILVPESP